MFTIHAREQMIKRGISPQETIHAITRGSKYVQTDGLLASYGYIQVAYKVRGQTTIIKTVMLR